MRTESIETEAICMFGSDLTSLLILLGILLVSPLIIALWAFFRTSDSKTKSAALEKRLNLLAREVLDLKSGQEKILAQLQGQTDFPKQTDAIEPEKEDDKADPERVADDVKKWNESHPEGPDEEPDETRPPYSSVPTGFDTPVQQSTTSASAFKKQSMEQAVGAKWSVWLGGLALALGAVFMVKHSIDQGYLTPAVRILFATLMSGALMAGGEWMRRRDVLADIGGVPGAYIPGALTAAGVVAAFATVYAAYALYHFIGPLSAFILLALVALGALAASIIHGPGLAAMGLAGAYVTPALVSTGHPNAWTLFTYLLFVSAANFIAAQMRGWLWLAISAVVASTAWGLIWYIGPWTPKDALPMSIYITVLLALALPFLKQQEPDLTPQQKQSLFAAVEFADWPVSLALGSISLLSVILLRETDYSGLSIGVFTITLGLFFLSAWRWLSLGFLCVLGAILFGLTYLGWHIPYVTNVFGDITGLWSTRPVRLPADALLQPQNIAVTPPEIIAFLTFGALFASAFAIIGFLLVRRHKGEPLFALVSTLVPLAAFIYAYWRVTYFDSSLSFGLLGLGLAVAAIFATDRLDKESSGEQGIGRRFEVSAGIYATAAVAAFALAVTIVLDKGWLTIALATMTPALALIARQRNMAVLGYLAGALAAIVAARLFYEPHIVGNLRGSLPIFNWLLYAYGAPALALALAASIFRKDRDDWVPDFLEAAAILFGTVLIFLQIRHLLHDGNIYSARFDLVENGLQTSVWVALSLAMHKLHKGSGRWVPEIAANLLGLVGMGSALLGLLLFNNPLFTGDRVGQGAVFNDLLLGYLLPAFLFLLLFWNISGERRSYYVRAVGGGAFALIFTYLSLELRTQFHNGHLSLTRTTSDPEWYAYSALWLVFGLVLLGVGIFLRQQQIRLASLALIGLVIVKVFLSDMAHLTGIWRALSFIGLGLALVGVGALYQRIIIPQTKDDQPNDRENQRDEN